MDSRIILIAFLLTVLCFETFTLSANKPTTTKVTTSGVVVDSQNLPVLTPRSVNGVYILVMKNHKSVYFVSNKANINKPNTIKFSGQLIDFNGMIKKNIIFPTYSGLKGKIASTMQSAMNGAQGYTGFSVGVFNYFTGTGAAKKIANGYLFLTRITKTMYYLSGFVDIIWSVVTFVMLVATLDAASAIIHAGSEALEGLSIGEIKDTILDFLSSLKNKFTSDSIDIVASSIKDSLTEPISKIKCKLLRIQEDIAAENLIDKMSDEDIKKLNNELKDMIGRDKIEINGQEKEITTLTKDDWKNYYNKIIDQLSDSYVKDKVLNTYGNGVKDILEEPLSNALKDVLRKNPADALKYVSDPNGFDKDLASEIAKKIEKNDQLKDKIWDIISEKDKKKLGNVVNLNGKEDEIENLFKDYHEGKIGKRKLLRKLKDILKFSNEKTEEVKKIIEDSPSNIKDLIYSEITGSKSYEEYIEALKNSNNNEIKEIFENVRDIDVKAKARLIRFYYKIYINPEVGIDINVNTAKDILENLKTAIEKDENIIDQNFGKDYTKKLIKNIENGINRYKSLTQTGTIVTRHERVFSALYLIAQKTRLTYLLDLLGWIKSTFVSVVDGGINSIADVLEKAGWAGKGKLANSRFFAAAVILLGLTNAVKNALYNWYVTNSIETGYTHGYLVVLNSSNPNEELILLAGTRFYSRFTDALMRHIPGFDKLFTFCSNPKMFTGKWALEWINDWVVNIPGTEDATQALLSVVPDRYTLILGNGSIMFDYPNKNVTIDSSNTLIMSRGAPVLNGTLKEIYHIELSYLYNSPVKVIGTHDYKITPTGYNAMVSALQNLGQNNEPVLILGLNPAQAIYISKIYTNTKDVAPLAVSGIIGQIANSGLASIIGTIVFGPAGGLLIGAITYAVMHLSKPWVIEVVGLGSNSKIALSTSGKLKSSCVTVVFSLLSAFNSNPSEKIDAENYENAVKFCKKFENDVNSVLFAFGIKSRNYLPITLDWYLYGPTNNIYIPGHIHGNLEISRDYNDKLALACALANAH